MTADLIEFLRARLDDDARIAQAAAEIDGERWSVAGPSSNDHDRVEGTTGWGAVGYDMVEPVTHHVARHDPARVLREVAAKRAILDDHEPAEALGRTFCTRCEHDHDGYPWPCPTIRALASIYDPRYRAEWA